MDLTWYKAMTIGHRALMSYTRATYQYDYSEVLIQNKGVFKEYFGKTIAIYVASKCINGWRRNIYVKEIK